MGRSEKIKKVEIRTTSDGTRPAISTLSSSTLEGRIGEKENLKQDRNGENAGATMNTEANKRVMKEGSRRRGISRRSVVACIPSERKEEKASESCSFESAEFEGEVVPFFFPPSQSLPLLAGSLFALLYSSSTLA